MDAVPHEILRAAYQRKPIYALKIPLHFALWAGCTWVLYATQDSPWAIPIGLACSLLIANLIRGLGAIAHDAVHGNVARDKTLAYLVSLLCWSPTGLSVTVYGNYHLHHHRITNQYGDVDNFVVTDYVRNPVLAKVLLLCVYSFAYPIYFGFRMFGYVKRLSTWHRVRMNLELAGIFGLVALAYLKMPHQVFFFFYGLPFVIGSFFASFTSMIEHFEMPATSDDAYSSRTYGTKADGWNFLWNNVSYHNEHHKYPGIPWYNLKSFHHAAYPHYDERVKAECYEGIFSVGFRLWGRVLRADVQKIADKYRGLDRDTERAKKMELPGIPAEAEA